MLIPNDLNELKSVLRRYSYKLSNNYFMPHDMEKLIGQGNLMYLADEHGLYLYERRNGYMKLFFNLNSLCAKLPYRAQTLVTYVIHDVSKKNNNIIAWLEEQGFTLEAKRIHLVANKLNVTPCFDGVSYAAPEEAAKLFAECFDAITSDLLLLNNYGPLLAVRGENSEILGAIHIGNPFIIAVRENARGKGIATKLFSAYAVVSNLSKYKLWSDPENTAAQKLYQKLGFAPDRLYTECYTHGRR